MANEAATFFDRWQTDQQQLKEGAPDIARAFGGMFQTLMKEGALSVREKELIALANGMPLVLASSGVVHRTFRGKVRLAKESY